jgi:ribose transport system substrate-binding protein
VPNRLGPYKQEISVGLFIEVAGGLLGVFIAFAIKSIAVGDFFKAQIGVHLWLFVFISTVAALALALQIRSWIFTKPSKRVVLVIPALAQNHWFAELIQETFRHLHRQNYEIILKIPYEQDFSKDEQKRIFENLERHPKDYVGGIIITHKHENIRKEITDLCSKISYPVIFADVRPVESESDYPANTAFVGYDARRIGELAAGRVAKHLREIRKERPIVKVICSATSQTRRQDAFCEELRALVPNVNLEVKRAGEFRRSNAKDIAMSFFDESVNKREFIDAVFCTNDEMALGVYDAMLTVDVFGDKPPFLIGVDGSKGAVRLIRDKDAYFNATIKQPTAALSQKIVTLLNQKINNEHCPVESFLEPELYDKELAQAESLNHQT